jgi:hypothetical protein
MILTMFVVMIALVSLSVLIAMMSVGMRFVFPIATATMIPGAAGRIPGGTDPDKSLDKPGIAANL